MNKYDTVVIGSGPAGLAAAIKAHDNNGKVLIIEREKRMGGILKQCIHDGFGLLYFKELLTGPEYAYRFIKEVKNRCIDYNTETYVIEVKNLNKEFHIKYVNKRGIKSIISKTIIFATGCRERTSKQVFIHGDRPSGVYTAGTAQYFTNIMGYLPGKNCVILGSGDIGLIMARRLTLEGSNVLGVYEIKKTPSGLTRNIRQCLDDFNIPLYLSHKITNIYGKNRLKAIEVCQVNDKHEPYYNTSKKIECDCLILSVGLIPENDLIKNLGVSINPFTKGPNVDDKFMSIEVPGLFICGNAVHVNDLVDYVTYSSEIAGEAAMNYIDQSENKELIEITHDDNIMYVVPQYINRYNIDQLSLYFRVNKNFVNKNINIQLNEKNIIKKFNKLIPAEMTNIKINNTEKYVNKIHIKLE